MIVAFLTVPASALLYRHRGGWIPTHHTQLARLDFSLGMALLSMLATWDWRMVASLPLWFAGCLAPNGDWMNIRSARELVWGCYGGLINVGPAVVLAALFGHWSLAAALIIAGALKGPAYFVAKLSPLNIPQFRPGPEMGECLFGALLGLSLGFA